MTIHNPSEDSGMHLPFKIIHKKNSIELVDSLVNFIEARLKKRLNESFPKPIGLATGRTMEPMYCSLVSRLSLWEKYDLDNLLENWKSFNLDEYVGLPKGDQRSFSAYMIRNLGKPLGLDRSQMCIPKSYTDDPFLEANSYSEQILNAGGIGFQLIGLGNNGHIGFNEPPCPLDCKCRVVTLSEATILQNAFAFKGNTEKVPKKAITLGISDILQAEEIHLVVTGKSKKKILSELINSSPYSGLPASWLKCHDNLFLWTDYNAFSNFN